MGIATPPEMKTTILEAPFLNPIADVERKKNSIRVLNDFFPFPRSADAHGGSLFSFPLSPSMIIFN
jgi:hypothetical protein